MEKKHPVWRQRWTDPGTWLRPPCLRSSGGLHSQVKEDHPLGRRESCLFLESLSMLMTRRGGDFVDLCCYKSLRKWTLSLFCDRENGYQVLPLTCVWLNLQVFPPRKWVSSLVTGSFLKKQNN